MDHRLVFPATARNVKPIGDVLNVLLTLSSSPCQQVLEIASGSGEHAVQFQQRFSSLSWQATDVDPLHISSINAWREHYQLSAMPPALLLDVGQPDWNQSVDMVVCINLIHVAPWSACVGLLSHAAQVLSSGGLLVLYGPFRVQGECAASNRHFDQSLRQQNPSWGLRDIEEVQQQAQRCGFSLYRLFEMPANNLTLVFKKQ